MGDPTQRSAVRPPARGAAPPTAEGSAPGLSAGVVDHFLELVPDAIVVIDASGRILSLNRLAEQMFGYPGPELVGEPIEILVPAELRGLHAGHRVDYFKDPRTRPMGLGLRLSGRRKDGTEFPVDISLSAIETADGIMVAAAVHDLTERTEAERARRALEAEAREARAQHTRRLESIGELAGGIAHDFNNMLAVILNNAELAERKAGNAGVSDELCEIRAAAEHGSKLTQQLLIFSRRQVSPREAVDLNAIVRDIERLLRGSIGEAIELDVGLGEQLPAVLADASQMEQVILNLAINARDAMPAGGRLGIETKVVELDETYARRRPEVTPGRYVRLTVADDGAGMSEEALARAFEPFFTTKAKGDGSGLGLSIAYGIVKSCGGEVSIYSEEDNGTVVRVHLPIFAGEQAVERPAEDAQRPAEDAPVDDGQGHGQTVVVVEDAEGVRRGVCEILRLNGYRVLEASRGEQARELVEAGVVDLVVTDVVMPEMLGTELAARLRESHPGVPVLFMSGYVDVAGPIENRSMLIEKPFTSDHLLAKVRDALAPAAAREGTSDGP